MQEAELAKMTQARAVAVMANRSTGGRGAVHVDSNYGCPLFGTVEDKFFLQRLTRRGNTDIELTFCAMLNHG